MRLGLLRVDQVAGRTERDGRRLSDLWLSSLKPLREFALA